MTVNRAQQAIVENAARQRVRDYHRALDQASRDAEGIADLIRPQDLGQAADRLVTRAMAALQALTNGDPQSAAAHAIELAGEALGLAATLTTKETNRG